jgi:hypothetical protein
MTAITDLDQYKSMLTAQGEPYPLTTSQTASVASRWSDTWLTILPVGAFPTTAVVPVNTTQGGIQHQNGGSGQLWIVGSKMAAALPTLGQSVVLIVDRLSHQGGLSGTTTSAQTTNLPTAALTRYTTGEGVMMGISVASQVGTTGTTITATYTNQAGTGGQVSPTVVFGGTGFREANRFIMLPLAAGDTGVRAVASVTVAVSTGTVGNFGVVLFKPLYAAILDDRSMNQVGDFVTGYTGGGIPEVVDNACLSAFIMGTGGGMSTLGNLFVAEV